MENHYHGATSSSDKKNNDLKALRQELAELLESDAKGNRLVVYVGNIHVTAIYPIIIVPAVASLAKVFDSKKNRSKGNTYL